MVVVGIVGAFGRKRHPFSKTIGIAELVFVFLINHLGRRCITPSFRERNASSEERTIGRVVLLVGREGKPRKVVGSLP